ncbi:hypothetical protein BCR42DRAFT_482062 [Absidia repens]|uniref:ubiquitinyl hydrolase 1 n=1 Tax=Absidia repens TaxID=90262 RepID=A0A1X2IMR1_9FUNG|nr:hypothetical protein BCR42DRAFT_482062 [Absidia repens]
MPPSRSDQSTKILNNSQLTKNTVDSLLGRAIKFRPSRYVDEKLDLFKRKFAPVNQQSSTATTSLNNAGNRSLTATYGHQEQSDSVTNPEELVDAYGFERPSKWLFPKDRLEPSWTTVRLIGAGLTDINNQTSALNAVLQCVTYTPLLSNYLTSKWHSANCTVQDYCFVCALEDHVKECLSSSGQRIAPRQFVGKMKKMKSGSSKDAHSIWSFFMDQIQHFLLLEKGSHDKRTQETTALYQTYFGHLQDRMECNGCQKQDGEKAPSDYHYRGFLDLTLDINQGSTVERCLSRHLQTMGLESSNECESCKKIVKDHYTIYQPPRVLALHLNRFDNNGSKNDKSIKFDENMDLSRFITPTQMETSNNNKPITQYQLCGLITHQGRSSIHGGRFVAYVKSSNGMWYCLDNESVQQVNNKRLLGQQAYMLFYTQQVKSKPRAKPTPAPQPAVSLETGEQQEDNDAIEQEQQQLADDDQPRNDDDNEEEEKVTLAKAILEAQNKPKLENKAAIIVKHDDTMDDKRSKLDALIEREAAEGKSQKAKEQLMTKATQSQFYNSVGRWDDDDQADEDMGTSVVVTAKEKERVALLQQMKTKRKKTDLYDMDYDRGKVKKIKEKQQDKFGKPNLFQAMADDAAEKKKNKKNKKRMGGGNKDNKN